MQHDASATNVEVDESLYPKEAVYGAAYTFIDRCYVHLDRAADRRIRITLRPKRGLTLDAAALAGEFQNELLGHAWRLELAAQNRAFIESIATRAIAGAAGPPGLDELLAMDIGEASAFDDPLGIAMSWEDKYKKKNAQPGSNDAAPDAGDAPAAGAKGGGPA